MCYILYCDVYCDFHVKNNIGGGCQALFLIFVLFTYTGMMFVLLNSNTNDRNSLSFQNTLLYSSEVSGIHVAECLVFDIVFCRPLFDFLPFISDIVLAVLRFTASDCSIDIFKLFFVVIIIHDGCHTGIFCYRFYFHFLLMLLCYSGL